MTTILSLHAFTKVAESQGLYVPRDTIDAFSVAVQLGQKRLIPMNIRHPLSLEV